MSQVIANLLVGPNNPSTIGGTAGTSTVRYFPAPPGASIGTQNATPSSTSAVGQLAVPGSGVLNGQPFNVIAAGDITAGAGGGSTTITVGLYAQTSAVLTSPSYTTLGSAAFAAEIADGVAYPFYMNFLMQGTTLSGIVQGTKFILIDNVVEQATAAMTALSGINFSNVIPFGLVVGVTFGTSESGNQANLNHFSIAS